MSHLIRLVTAALLAVGLTFVAGGSATAAPASKGYNEVSSSLLNLAPLLGIQVTASGPATQTATGIHYPIVGNTAQTGVQMSVGGTMLTLADGSTFVLSDSHYDLSTGVVSMVVNGGDRVDMFTGTEAAPGTVVLKFTADGAQAIADALGLPLMPGLLAEGATFGTSTTHLP